jgi:hypothetical protein
MSLVSTLALLFQGVRLVSLGLLLPLLISLYVDGVVTALFQLNPTVRIVEFSITLCRIFYAIRESTLQSLTEPLRVSY